MNCSRRGVATFVRALLCGALLLGASAGGAAGVVAAPPSPSSDLTGVSVFWLSVSPAYERTGLVVAQAKANYSECQKGCIYATHDGGASWARVPSVGWNGGRMVVTVDGTGHEVILSGGGTDVQRSDDGGLTWSRAGSDGFAQPEPTFPHDGAFAVAGTHGDYVVRNGTAQSVTGSTGTLTDISFMFSPTFPVGDDSHPPALLSAMDKTTGLPVIQQCTAQLACKGRATLADSIPYSIPVTLYPSAAYASDRTVFAQSGRGIYKSTDAGATFVPLPMGEAGATATATPMLALAPGYEEAGPVRAAYAAVLQAFHDTTNPKNDHSAGGIYKTDDGGKTWSAVGSPGPFDKGASAVAVAPDGRIFAAYLSSFGSGLLCSIDSGTTWRASCPAVGEHPGGQASKAGGGAGGASCRSTCSDQGASNAGSVAGAKGSEQHVGQGAAALGGTESAAVHGSAGKSAGIATGLALAGVAVVLAVAALVRRRFNSGTAKVVVEQADGDA